MCQKLLGDARFFRLLLLYDEDLAAIARAGGCLVCGGPVHRARYPRKPRGGPSDLGAAYDRRESFCCAKDGCRKRLTPPSLRFLGRKVYLGAVVVLISAMMHGASAKRLKRLRATIGASRYTIERWRAWWRTTFAESAWWKGMRGRFSPPVATSALPNALLARFVGDAEERLVALLRFLAPLTTTAASPLAEGRR